MTRSSTTQDSRVKCAAHAGSVAALTCFYGRRNENQAARPRTRAAHAEPAVTNMLTKLASYSSEGNTEACKVMIKTM